MIQPGQIYRSCQAPDFRIRIRSVGTTTAKADDVANRRPLLNPVMIRDLHATATTRNGQPRRTGYALEAGQ